MHSGKLPRFFVTFLPLVAALLACGSSAQAACYAFTSSAAGITVTADITITNQTIQNLTPGQTRIIKFSYTGNFTETIGTLTLTDSGTVTNAVGITYEGVPGTVPWTALVMGSAAGPKGSQIGYATPVWAVSLNGTGDLLPNGLTPVLPPISAWQYSPGNGVPGPGNHLMIYPNGVTVTKMYDVIIDNVSSCGGLADELLGDPADRPGFCNCGDPINVATGNLYEQVADYQTAGLNKLLFSRYYNSTSASTTLATSLGSSWRSIYDRYLRIASATSVIAERPDGQQIPFTLTGGAWTTDPDIDVKLTNSGTTWTLTDVNDTVETYQTTGTTQALLHSIRARNGYTQNLQFNADNQLTAATDSYQRQLAFTYSNGLLQTVTTPDGLVLTYAYAPSGSASHLTSVIYSTSPATSQIYLYENTAFPNALTGINDENGNHYATWTYDSQGRALTSQHAEGADLTKVAYNDTDGSRTVTYPLGAQVVYKFTTTQNVPKVTEIDRLATATTPTATSKITYDKNGFTASRTDWNGNLTTYVNDAHGQATTVAEAAGTAQARATTVTYHPTFHLPAKIVEPGLTTTLTYDGNGELLTRTLTDTTTSTVPYSTNGQTRTWTYTWSNSLPASIKTPRTDVNDLMTFTYDSSGALTSTTNALGQKIQITQHRPGGLPQAVVDANGVSSQLTYDARQRLLSSAINTAAGALTTSYSYDAAGNLISITSPDGSSYTNTYDAAHRLQGVADLFNQTAAYSLDALGDRTQSSFLDSNGVQQRLHSAKFDVLGRLLQDIGGAGQATKATYDANGNATSITDPLSQATQHVFDPLNRLVRTTDPAKGVATTTYDAHDRPLTFTDPNGGATSYVYDGFGDMIQRVSPDSGTLVCHYDADGHLTQSVDGAGVVVNYTYDALDRLSTVSYPANPAENVTYTYDQTSNGFGIGRLTAVTDAAGTLSRTYDERGNVLSETRVVNGVTLIMGYTYDAAGQVASITYPSGWTVAYTRDAMGRTTAITAQTADGATSLPVLTAASYQPFGPVNALAFGNGIAETRGFDLDYRLTSLTDAGAAALQNLTYTYDAGNEVVSITDGVTPGASQTFGYDAVRRLTGAQGGYGNITYTYDAAGNRLTQSGGAVASFTYSAHSNQLLSMNAGGAQQPVGYTKAGNVNSVSISGAGANLVYNQAGRLATVTVGGNPIVQCTYDAFGHRLIKVGAVSGTTLYQYGVNSRLLEEADGGGSPLVDYIYLDSLPVATLSPVDGQIYYLHTDRFGTPQTATDSNQNVVWTASYGPFGEMSTTPSLIVQNLRLPGQEFDIDTGLYHNGFRNYVPSLGRYLESDPIGLAGGVNTYAYARGNPVNAADPSGLVSYTDANGVVHQAEDVIFAQPGSAQWNSFVNTPGDSSIFTVGGHGDPNIMFDASLSWAMEQAHAQGLSLKDYLQQNPGILGNPVDHILTPEQLADIIRSSSNYHPGEPVRLDSCNTGNTNGSLWGGPFAQRLADALGAPVWAPNNTVWSGTGGLPIVAPPKTNPDGSIGPDLNNQGSYLLFNPRTSVAYPTI